MAAKTASGRRGDVPFVDEDVGAHQPGEPEDRLRQRPLHAQRRVRGVALGAEVADQPGAGDGLGEAEAVELARRAHGGGALEEGLRAARGADLHADMAVGRLVARDLAVRDPRGDLHRLARAEQVHAALLDDLQGAGHDLVVLDLPGVHVRLHEEAARAPEHVELEQLAVGLRRRPDELHPAAQLRHLQNVARVRHLRPSRIALTATLFAAWGRMDQPL